MEFNSRVWIVLDQMGAGDTRGAEHECMQPTGVDLNSTPEVQPPALQHTN